MDTVTNSSKPAQLQSHSCLQVLLAKLLIGIYYLPVISLDSHDSEISEAKPLFLLRKILTCNSTSKM